LNVYRNSEPEELAGLHPADRLMVKLIQIERLGPRINGMLYRISFDEQWGLLDEVSHFQSMARVSPNLRSQSARKLSEAGKGLMTASHFKELLNVRILGCRASYLLTVFATRIAYSTHR
jgi:cytokinesis protein